MQEDNSFLESSTFRKQSNKILKPEPEAVDSSVVRQPTMLNQRDELFEPIVLPAVDV